MTDSASAVMATFKNAPPEFKRLAMPDALVRLEMRLLKDKLSRASARGVVTGSAGPRST